MEGQLLARDWRPGCVCAVNTHGVTVTGECGPLPLGLVTVSSLWLYPRVSGAY